MKILPLKIFCALFFALVLFSACEKKDDNVSPKKQTEEEKSKNILSSKDGWTMEDGIVDLNYNYSITGYNINVDSTYSIFEGDPECTKDVNYYFRETGLGEFEEGENYCGEENEYDDEKYYWDLEGDKFVLTGKDAAGLVYIDLEDNGTSLGDTATYDVLQLDEEYFKFKYRVPIEELYAKAGIDESTIEKYNVVFSGSMYVTYTLKRK